MLLDSSKLPSTRELGYVLLFEHLRQQVLSLLRHSSNAEPRCAQVCDLAPSVTAGLNHMRAL